MEAFAVGKMTASLNRDWGDDANMFEVAPVSLWLEDYSQVKALFDVWRQSGVANLRE
jgi:hypothetical protein